MVVTKEAALMLIFFTYTEFYLRIRGLNVIARENDIYEAREIKRIYDEFNTIYGLTDQDYEETIQRKIKESLNEDLTNVSNEELAEILLECITLVRLYDLTMRHILTSDIEIIERLNNEESDKLIEVRGLLGDDVEIGKKVLADIDSGLIILMAYDAFEYVDNNGNTRYANGFFRSDPDIIGFQIFEKKCKNYC